MSDTLQEFADIPKDFFKDGTAFLNRCTKRTSLCSRAPKFLRSSTFIHPLLHFTCHLRRTPANSLHSRPTRIHQDQPSSRHGLPHHGRNRLRDQADTHPREQHISGRRIVASKTGHGDPGVSGDYMVWRASCGMTRKLDAGRASIPLTEAKQ
jgi:hypothetical protein